MVFLDKHVVKSGPHLLYCQTAGVKSRKFCLAARAISSVVVVHVLLTIPIAACTAEGIIHIVQVRTDQRSSLLGRGIQDHAEQSGAQSATMSPQWSGSRLVVSEILGDSIQESLPHHDAHKRC